MRYFDAKRQPYVCLVVALLHFKDRLDPDVDEILTNEQITFDLNSKRDQLCINEVDPCEKYE